MAYRLPRIGASPKTPKSMDESPREVMACSRQKKAYMPLVLCLVGALLVLLGIRSYFSATKQTDRIPYASTGIDDFFSHFEGHQECGISSPDLYTPPIVGKTNKHAHYCPDRATLLTAMSGGGRHGFDAPFAPAGCHYRWYSLPEICMILERFDAVVFIGDDLMKHVYAAFNMFLRQDLAIGSLKQWEMTEADRDLCKCDNQITRPECAKYSIGNSEDLKKNDHGSGHTSSYYCDRIPHFLLPITTSPAPDELHTALTTILAKDPDSYKPVPVVHSLGLATSLSWPSAIASMDEWVALADASQRNVPFLWLGPNAAGHLKPPGQIMSQGNNALWHYTIEMAKEASSRELDALGMYNLTLQASSWDGSNYAQKVALVQAMMVINWLSRLETT